MAGTSVASRFHRFQSAIPVLRSDLDHSLLHLDARGLLGTPANEWVTVIYGGIAYRILWELMAKARSKVLIHVSGASPARCPLGLVH